MFPSDITIEKFAAYMDGNLSTDEFNEITSIIETNDLLKEFCESFQEVDDVSVDSDLQFFEAERDGVNVTEITLPTIDEGFDASIEFLSIMDDDIEDSLESDTPEESEHHLYEEQDVTDSDSCSVNDYTFEEENKMQNQEFDDSFTEDIEQ